MSARGYLSLLRAAPSFRRWVLADSVCMAGDWFTYIAMASWGSQGGRSPESVVVVLLSQSLPRALWSPAAGWCADRFDRRSLALAAHLARGLLVLGMAQCARAGMLPAVHALHFCRMSLGAFAEAAHRAALPCLVEKEDLATANALVGLSWSVLFALGVLAGGLTVDAFGATTAFLLDAASYFAAAALLLRAPALAPARDAEGRVRASWREFGALLRARPALGRLAVSRAPLMLCQGAGFLAATLGSLREAAHGATALGVLHLARGVGTGVGPWLARRPFAGPPARAERWLWASSVLVGLQVALLALRVPWYVRVMAAFGWGTCTGIGWVGSGTLVQRSAPSEVQGRMAGVDLFAYPAANVAGAFFALAALRATGALASGGALCAGVAACVVLLFAAHARRWPL